MAYIQMHQGEELRRAVSRFFIPLQTARVVDQAAFEQLAEAARNLATALKPVENVPKSLLKEIYYCVGILRSEAPYFAAKSDQLRRMADELEITFGNILIGEAQGDRTPGVPRII